MVALSVSRCDCERVLMWALGQQPMSLAIRLHCGCPLSGVIGFKDVTSDDEQFLMSASGLQPVLDAVQSLPVVHRHVRFAA